MGKASKTKQGDQKRPAVKTDEADEADEADFDDDEDDEANFDDAFKLELREDQMSYLLGCRATEDDDGENDISSWWKGNGRILYDLLHPGHLQIVRYGAFGTEEEVGNDLNDFEVVHKGFVEIFPGENRGSTAASSGRLHVRTLDIIEKIPRWTKYIEAMRTHLTKQWKEKKIMTDDQKVVVKKLWVGKAMSAEEQKKEGNTPGLFNKHFDNYGVGSLVRTIGTLCDSNVDKKIMGFDFFDEEVTFPTPHGTVVIMDRTASGADGRNYRHWIEGAQGTYTLCMELGIAVGNEGDLQKWAEKRDNEGAEEEDAMNHAMGE